MVHELLKLAVTTKGVKGMKRLHRALIVTLMVSSMLIGGTSWADIIVTVPFTDSGFFGEDGRSSKEDGEVMGFDPTVFPGFANYHVGLSTGLTGPDVVVRNFFIFGFRFCS